MAFDSAWEDSSDYEDAIDPVEDKLEDKADTESIDAALAMIKAITAEPEEGETYKGKVKALAAFGAFVEIMPGKEGLLHISEIDHKRINKVEDVLKEGDEIEVKLIEVDKKTKKMKLSRKALLPKPVEQ